MSAIPEEFLQKTAKLSDEVTRPFAQSKKIYVTGSRADIRVPMREVTQAPTHTERTPEENPPIYIYDTSGPYTDPAVKIDLLQGLPAVRAQWIEERNDSEQLQGPTSHYGAKRQSDPKLAHQRFEHIHAPRRAKVAPDGKSGNVSQMHYAKQGIITPEMEYVAIRENLKLQDMRNDPRYAKLLCQHAGCI